MPACTRSSSARPPKVVRRRRMSDQELQPGRWLDGELPANTRVGPGSVITSPYAFKRFRSRLDPALVVGAHCTLDGVHFALGEEGRMEIGDYCYFTNAVL